MKNPRILACTLLLLPLVLGLTLQEDDLVFDDVGEDSTSTAATVISRRFDDRRTSWHEQQWPHDVTKQQVERLWGVPDVVVPVGHVLKLRIPRQAFTGPVDYYEVRSNPRFPPSRAPIYFLAYAPYPGFLFSPVNPSFSSILGEENKFSTILLCCSLPGAVLQRLSGSWLVTQRGTSTFIPWKWWGVSDIASVDFYSRVGSVFVVLDGYSIVKLGFYNLYLISVSPLDP